MILSQIEQALQIVAASVVFALGAWIYIDWKQEREELKELREKALADEVANDKIKIHEEYKSKDLDELLDSSPDIYRKLGPPKDN